MKLIGISFSPTKVKFHCTSCPVEYVFLTEGEKPFPLIRQAKRTLGWVHPHNGTEFLCPECVKPRVKDSDRKPLKSKIDIPEAVKLYNDGASFKELAKKYGVTRARVHLVLQHLVDKDRLRKKFCSYCEDLLTEDNTKKGQHLCCDKEECLVKAGQARYCKGCKKLIRGKVRSGTCIKCHGRSRRTFDYTLAEELYKRLLTGPQIAVVMRKKIITVYMALRKAGVEFRKIAKPTLTKAEAHKVYKEVKAAWKK